MNISLFTIALNEGIREEKKQAPVAEKKQAVTEKKHKEEKKPAEKPAEKPAKKEKK